MELFWEILARTDIKSYTFPFSSPQHLIGCKLNWIYCWIPHCTVSITLRHSCIELREKSRRMEMVRANLEKREGFFLFFFLSNYIVLHIYGFISFNKERHTHLPLPYSQHFSFFFLSSGYSNYLIQNYGLQVNNKWFR